MCCEPKPLERIVVPTRKIEGVRYLWVNQVGRTQYDDRQKEDNAKA